MTVFIEQPVFLLLAILLRLSSRPQHSPFRRHPLLARGALRFPRSFLGALASSASFRRSHLAASSLARRSSSCATGGICLRYIPNNSLSNIRELRKPTLG